MKLKGIPQHTAQRMRRCGGLNKARGLLAGGVGAGVWPCGPEAGGEAGKTGCVIGV